MIDDHEPGNAPGLSSRVVGEKTSFTLSFVFVHPGGGSCFFTAQADTAAGGIILLVVMKMCLEVQSKGKVKQMQITYGKQEPRLQSISQLSSHPSRSAAPPRQTAVQVDCLRDQYNASAQDRFQDAQQ